MTRMFCGIDIAKSSFHAAAIDPEGRLLWSQAFHMRKSDFQALLQRLPAVGEVQILMESTGIYYRPLFDFLKREGHDVRVVNPLLIEKFNQECTLRKTKTDKRDALTIAEYLRQKGSALKPIPEVTELQAFARARQSLVVDTTRLKNQIKSLLTVSFPEISQLIDPFTNFGLELLTRYPSKGAVLAASRITLPGRRSRLTSQALRRAAADSIGVSSPAEDEVLRALIRCFRVLQAELAQITARLSESCRRARPEAMKSLLSIPGVGEITASHFLAETHGRTFASARSLIAFAGLDPKVEESGIRKRGGKITKRGNKSLRRALFLMAQSVVQKNAQMNQYFQTRRSQGKPYKQAILAVAHKLIRLIHALLTKQEIYQPAWES